MPTVWAKIVWFVWSNARFIWAKIIWFVWVTAWTLWVSRYVFLQLILFVGVPAAVLVFLISRLLKVLHARDQRRAFDTVAKM